MRPATSGEMVRWDRSSVSSTPGWSKAISIPVSRGTSDVASPGRVDAIRSGQAAWTAHAASVVPSARSSSKR